MRSTYILLLSATVALLTSACSAERDVRVLKLGHGLDVTHPVHRAMVYMGEEIERESNGAIRLEVYPSQQLGTERETLELLQIGSLDLTKVSSSVVEGFEPIYKVFSVPFLFQSDEHRFQVLDGSIGDQVLDAGRSIRLQGLTYYDAGTRSFYTKDRAVHHPDDLKGLKIRVQESPAAIQMVNMLGGSATPISWGELYTALQQGIVDGAENNPPSFHLSRHYEVAKYYTINEHTAVPDILFMSRYTWDRLSEDEQRIIRDAAKASAIYQRELWQESTRKAMEEVEAAGVQVIRPDKAPFVERLQPLYEIYVKDDPRLEPIIREIQRMAQPAEDAAAQDDESAQDAGPVASAAAEDGGAS